MSRIWSRIEIPAYALRIPEVVAAVELDSPQESHSYRAVQSYADETRSGEFAAIERALKKLRIPYDVRQEADHESAETLTCYRPSDGKSATIKKMVCANGETVVTLAALRGIVRRAKTPKSVNHSLQRLMRDGTVAAITDLVTPPGRLVRRMTLPDPTDLSDFNVKLTAMATVEGTLRVQARNAEEANRLAKERSGDVMWRYNGVEGEVNVMAVAVG